MELFQLRSFLRVVEAGSITRAAERLYLTQPAVTQHVRALERELGVPLFDRTRRGVALTQAGQVLYQYAHQCMALLEECRQVISDLEAGRGGRFVLGAGVTTSIFHLPRWLRRLREEYPGIEVVVRTGRSAQVAALALDREIDLGLVTSPVQHPDLRVVGLYEEEISLVTPHHHPLANRLIQPEELAETPLILFPKGTGFRDYLDRVLASAGILPWVKMESDSVEAIKSFVAIGLGVSFLPEAAVATEKDSGELARARIAGLPPLKRQTSAIYRVDRYLCAGARAFLRIVCEEHRVPLPDSPTLPNEALHFVARRDG